jgi:hypothetical protein
MYLVGNLWSLRRFSGLSHHSEDNRDDKENGNNKALENRHDERIWQLTNVGKGKEG